MQIAECRMQNDPAYKDMRAQRRRRNKIKVLMVMFFAVIIGALGDISLSKGMKAVGAIEHETLLKAFVAGTTNPFVLAGVGLLIFFLFLYLASLSWEDLSFVLPLTAADYVLVTLLAHFLLKEDVSPLRWAGSVLVATGIAIVART
ncbi:MAG: EamA family transporter [Armatimonadetes bacterium]|nr:EamA family transporter [Armatimonadota bacterium]